MSVQDDLAAVKRCLEDLVRTVGKLERSLMAERDAPATPTGGHAERMVTVPDAPYDSGMWTDSDDEGLGVRDRHAP